MKHRIISATQGHDDSIKYLMDAFKKEFISKEILASALRAHQTAVDATESSQRMIAEEYSRIVKEEHSILSRIPHGEERHGKEVLAAILRAHQKAVDATKSPQKYRRILKEKHSNLSRIPHDEEWSTSCYLVLLMVASSIRINIWVVFLFTIFISGKSERNKI